MGCVQAKGSSVYSPAQSSGLEKLKLENGYVKGDNAVTKPTTTLKEFNKSLSGGDRKISRESESKIISEKRILVKKINGADELVDGWPRWLVENVHLDALAGLVPKSADSYDKLAKVGQGTYSNVYKARDKSTGKIVALKKVRFDTSEPRSVKFMAREIIILKKLDHPNIIKLEGIATSRMQYSLYLVFDFMPSDLTKVISRPQGRLTESQVKFYPSNKFGLYDRASKTWVVNAGEELYAAVACRAPELLLGSTDYGVGIDLWSAGCLLAEMFVGRPIMPGRNEIEQLHKIFKLCGSPSEDYWKKVKPPATFRPPHQYKPNFQDAFPYFPDSAFGLLGRLLALDPSYRGTATSALQSEFFTTSPLPCDPSGLPGISTEEDQPIQSTDKKRNRILNAKQRSQRSHGRKVSFPDHIGDAAYNKEEIQISMSFQGQETGSSSSSTKPSSSSEIPPRSPSPAFRSQHNRSSKTEAHPNALKNIKNYPLLLASLTEAAHHLEQSNSNLYRRSISNIDFRNLDLEKISKLFGLEDDHA
ncbi:hypothetical protein RD792_008645 [Penstemon davidsonii]|uniref:Protein kinase domain-containing protein n=1 Tax=Penstemon davidsonii TaxID=160366 RepID=A0ABR0D9V0_9LAMI|nr:hypothetical protein RD792_008645 [Penstemon davidsonii]